MQKGTRSLAREQIGCAITDRPSHKALRTTHHLGSAQLLSKQTIVSLLLSQQHLSCWCNLLLAHIVEKTVPISAKSPCRAKLTVHCPADHATFAITLLNTRHKPALSAETETLLTNQYDSHDIGRVAPGKDYITIHIECGMEIFRRGTC